MRAPRTIGLLMAVALLTALVAGGVTNAATGTASLTYDNVTLYSSGGGPRDFKLKNGQGDVATISLATEQLVNARGRRVGKMHWQCVNSDTFWYCDGVIALNSAARYGAGHITFAGLFSGFNGESFAITGGTGEYVGAQGTIVLKVENEQFLRVLKLI